MEAIVELFQNLSETQRNHLLSSPSMREGFSFDVSDELGLPAEVIHKELEKIIAKNECDVEKIVELSAPISMIRRPSIEWDKGEPYLVKEQKANLMNEFMELLEDSDGLTKTGLLKLSKKDNGRWRKLSDDVLEYMQGRGLIVQTGNVYHKSGNFLHRETTFHRRVYDCICDGPISSSAILNRLGYRNSKGSKKLNEVLDIMMSENIVYRDGRKWYLVE